MFASNTHKRLGLCSEGVETVDEYISDVRLRCWEETKQTLWDFSVGDISFPICQVVGLGSVELLEDKLALSLWSFSVCFLFLCLFVFNSKVSVMYELLPLMQYDLSDFTT